MTTSPYRIRALLYAALIPCSLLGLSEASASQADQGAFPGSIDCTVQPYYRHRPDGKPGREVILHFKGAPLQGVAQAEVRVGNRRETHALGTSTGQLDSAAVLLPEGVGVAGETPVAITVRQGSRSVTRTVQVPPMRHWTVYVYPHSHVDIGYSNTHANVEFIHKRNLEEGIALAETTAGFPGGARYRWNPEVLWPVERYLKDATPAQAARVKDAVRQGEVCLDGAYVHLLTSVCSDEEMFQAMRVKRQVESTTGTRIGTYVQVDIPGMTWGLVPVLAQEGVRYVLMMPNPGRGNAPMVNQFERKPFWWVGPDGTSRVLFMHAGGYTIGLEKGGKTGRPWFGQRDRAKIPPVIRTESPRAYFVDKHLFRALPELEAAKYPYDLYMVTWAMWDNALQDADLPYAVRSWNEDYAFPRLVIAGAHEIMKTFEERYGKDLPVVTGDFSEYWNDGPGTAAKQTRMSRNAKERLVQAEVLWSMLQPQGTAPRAALDEAWRNAIMCTEHTYTYENPHEPYFQDAIWKMKQRHFQEAEEQTQALFDEALAPATDKSNGALGPAEGPSKGGIAVFNTQSWPHGGLVALSPAESRTGSRVVDEKGVEVPSQRLSTGVLVFMASDIPAFGSRHYRVVQGEQYRGSSIVVSDTELDNGRVKITLDRATGTVKHLVERSSGREYVDASVNGGLNAFRWQPGKQAAPVVPAVPAGEGPLPVSPPAQADTVVSIDITESGPLVGELRVTSSAPGCRSVTRSVRLVAGQPAVEFANVVDKLPLLPKDGVHFGFGFQLPGPTTRVEIPWAIMRVEEDQWPAANRAWMATQHFVDISNEEAGITWCSLDAPLIESGSITANNTADWDGRGDIWPQRLEPSATLYSWVMNNHWYTNTPLTQEGPVEFRYRLLVHGPYDAVSAYRFGVEQRQPLVPLATNAAPAVRPPVALEGDRVVATILKPTGDGTGMIVRLRSLSEKGETASLSWPAGAPKSVRICEKGETPGSKEVRQMVPVPAKGVVTLIVQW